MQIAKLGEEIFIQSSARAFALSITDRYKQTAALGGMGIIAISIG
jgi:hypothetical protein